MGSHRSSRSERSFRRKEEKRSGQVILIVCEGGKTEPAYFNGLCCTWRLSQVHVAGKMCGSAPVSVVDHAIMLRDKRRREAKRGRLLTYDEVLCVLDHEGANRHPTLSEALAKAHDKGFQVALSVPCFEFWYLLHFKYTTRRFAGYADVVSELRQYIPHYDKSKEFLSELVPRLEEALKNAEMVRKDNETTQSEWPATDVDKLVQVLMSMRRKSAGLP